jgi:hypothetical protein
MLLSLIFTSSRSISPRWVHHTTCHGWPVGCHIGQFTNAYGASSEFLNLGRHGFLSNLVRREVESSVVEVLGPHRTLHCLRQCVVIAGRSRTCLDAESPAS